MTGVTWFWVHFLRHTKKPACAGLLLSGTQKSRLAPACFFQAHKKAGLRRPASFRHTKKPACAGLLLSGTQKSRLAPAFSPTRDSVRGAGLRQLADLRVEAALMASSLVLVDQATRSVAVHDRLSGGKSLNGGCLVLVLNGLDDLLEGGAHHGTGADVAQAALLGLARALLRGLDVGQGRTPK